MSHQVLYRFYGNNNQLLYVGISNTWYQRFHDHEKKSGWFSKVTYSTFEWHETRESVEAAELIAIRSENPEFNLLHNPAWESPTDHFKKLKNAIHTGQKLDDLHQLLLTKMREDWHQIKKPLNRMQSKWIAMVFLNSFYDFNLGVWGCRNCVALANSGSVNNWSLDAYNELDGK
jgi:predicted GIY-YIG superfamily endonuclease